MHELFHRWEMTDQHYCSYLGRIKHDVFQPLCDDETPTWVAVNLILRNDDLAGVGVIGVLNGVAQDADHTDHLTRLANAVRYVAGVTDELLTASHLQDGWERMSTQPSTGQTNRVTSWYQICRRDALPRPQILLRPRGRLPSLSHPLVCSACRCLHRWRST